MGHYFLFKIRWIFTTNVQYVLALIRFPQQNGMTTWQTCNCDFRRAEYFQKHTRAALIWSLLENIKLQQIEDMS